MKKQKNKDFKKIYLLSALVLVALFILSFAVKFTCETLILTKEKIEEKAEKPPVAQAQTTIGITIVSDLLPACGNFIFDPGEECDDGNLINGDGCSSTCTIEAPPPPPPPPVAVVIPGGSPPPWILPWGTRPPEEIIPPPQIIKTIQQIILILIELSKLKISAPEEIPSVPLPSIAPLPTIAELFPEGKIAIVTTPTIIEVPKEILPKIPELEKIYPPEEEIAIPIPGAALPSKIKRREDVEPIIKFIYPKDKSKNTTITTSLLLAAADDTGIDPKSIELFINDVKVPIIVVHETGNTKIVVVYYQPKPPFERERTINITLKAAEKNDLKRKVSKNFSFETEKIPEELKPAPPERIVITNAVVFIKNQIPHLTGKTEPNATVSTIWNNNKEFAGAIAIADQNGLFNILAPIMFEEGKYTVTAFAQDEYGRQSEKINIAFDVPKPAVQILVGNIILIISLLIIFIIALIYIFHLRRKIKRLLNLTKTWNNNKK